LESSKLGRIKQIDLRDVWKNEQADFTPWLAQEENIKGLSDALNLEIKVLKTEAEIGDFNLDIQAEDSLNNNKIIIENQLEITNHDHLGKLITYASNTDARIVIWVVRDYRDEHKQAIDWLNENMNEDINFFLVKVELLKINDSVPAPRFDVISSPNDWAKTIKKISNDTSLTDTKMKQFEFWSEFKKYLEAKSKLRPRKASPQHWYNLSYGNSNAHITLTINSKQNLIGCEIYIPESKDYFKQLLSNRKAIEEELGEELIWMELPDKKASRILITKSFNFEEEANWKEAFEWLKNEAEKFYHTFSKYKQH
jgi:hypothetical protein